MPNTYIILNEKRETIILANFYFPTDSPFSLCIPLPQALSCVLNCANLMYTETEGHLEDFAVGQQIEAAPGFDDVVLRIKPKGEEKDNYYFTSIAVFF